MILVGDIGGTNLRFALAETPTAPLQHRVAWAGDAFADLTAALEQYLKQTGASPTRAALAVAGPVLDDRIELTNRPWTFSRRTLAERFALSAFVLLNDFEALAEALPHLAAADSVPIGSAGRPTATGRLAVVGPGTGLGIASAVETRSGWVALPGEGGHTTFAATTAAEDQARRYWEHALGERVSNEHLLSGPGLARLHTALCGEVDTPAVIAERAAAGDPRATATVQLWLGQLGQVAGDVALLTLATGGVYLAGGILPGMIATLQQSDFRRRFDAKGREAPWIAAVPTAVIVADDCALRGCAARLAADERAR
jgi:glucokinase